MADNKNKPLDSQITKNFFATVQNKMQFLQFNDAEILQNNGKITAAIAKAFAESKFEQYRVIQDRLYQSDFDRLVASTEENN